METHYTDTLSAKNRFETSYEVPKPLKAPLAGAFLFLAVRAAYCKPKWLEAIATGRNPWDIIAGLRQNRGRKMKAVHIKALVVCVLAFALPGAYAKDPSRIHCTVQASFEEAERQLLNVRGLSEDAIVAAASSRGFCAGLAKNYQGKGRAAEAALRNHQLLGKPVDPAMLHSLCSTHADIHNNLLHHRCLPGQVGY